ncbi:MAG: acetyl-CoA C-acetyltransferase [Chloroflexi bacterium]|nr:acetyl-CoA C-acetyltransferase [Chloroflexota bacterium]
MREVAIVSSVRTAVGRYGGGFRDLSPQALGEIVIREALKRANVRPEQVEEVIFGHVMVNGESPNVARLSALMADIPIEVPAYTLDRQCGSGLQAICNAALLIQTGEADVVVAGGTESMSNGEYYLTSAARWGLRMGPATLHDRFPRAVETVSCPEKFGPIGGMIHTAENLAEKYEISREEADRFALGSHQKAIAAIEAGRFVEEIVPVAVPQPKGEPKIVDRDEHPRADTSLASLAKLRPVLGKTVTAGNSSGMNDAAAAAVLMTPEKARELGIEPMGFLRQWSVAGCHPSIMGIGPVPAVRKLLDKSRLSLSDFGLIELNEAFAVQALAVLKGLEISDFSNVNVSGSGISIGHPVGATGARILATLIHEMKRRDVRYGLETMCIGGGMGIAAVIEKA